MELRDLVIVVPGIMGSDLSQHGRPTWACSLRRLAHIALTRGESLASLALKEDPQEVDDLGDGVVATDLIHVPMILPRLVKADGYHSLIRRIGNYFDIIQDGEFSNLCGFPYDWRRDCRVAAKRLKRFVSERLSWCRGKIGLDAKVIIVAHSMGGLVSRYFLDVLGGWRDCRALFTLGTPFRGAPQALEYLANGYTIGRFVDVSDTVKTFTSIYQLLPTYPMVTTVDGSKRIVETIDIPNLDYQKVKAARDFHAELRNAVIANLEDQEYVRNGYRLIPFIGRDQPTCQSAELTTGKLTTCGLPPHELSQHLVGGDGTVPRLSASPQDLDGQTREAFVVERHASLHVNEAVLIDLIGKIEQLQVPGTENFLGGRLAGEQSSFSLFLDDWYPAGKNVSLSASSVGGEPNATPIVRVKPIDSVLLTPPSVLGIQTSNNEWIFELGVLAEGEYQVTVSDPEGAASSVHDLFEVSQA